MDANPERMCSFLRKLTLLLLAALLATALALPSAGWALPDDYDAVMRGIGLSTPQTLYISKPAGNITTTASGYYITGSSDPSQPLTMNGHTVHARGDKGSFGVFVQLAIGENIFTFAQGGVNRTVAITRNKVGAYGTTKTLSSLYPASDRVVRSGDTLKITAIGPAGGSVRAKIGNRTVRLKQNVAAAVEGVPAYFSGEFTAPAVSGLVNLGRVSYTLSFGGVTTTHASEGELYVAARGHPVVVQVTDTAVCLFEKDSTDSSYLSVLDFGMLDMVTETGDLYKLSMGGWVPKSAVEIRPTLSPAHNRISRVGYQRLGREEQYVFTGTSFPGYTTMETDDTFYISFADTSGLTALSVRGSALFTGCTVTRGEDGYTTLAFARRPGVPIWGYLVEYEDGGITRLSFRTKPALSAGDRPLSGVSVLIDPGHGGRDVGALGMPNSQNATPRGPTESAINLATGLALKNKLELLGASVMMTRTTDANPSLNSRMMLAKQNRADFYISLHANAVSGDGTHKGGTEVYYYHDHAASLAERIAGNVSAATGRLSRGGKFSSYKVTLGSFGPSVLVEMGFVTNPVEYDQLIDSHTIYKTATAIADSIIAELKA